MDKPKKKRSRAEIIVWVFICFIIGVGVLAVVIPNFVKAHSSPCVSACVNNLRWIDSAISQFAVEHNLTNGTPINFPNDLTPYFKHDKLGNLYIPKCPSGGVYSVKKVGEMPTCSLGTTVTPAHVLQ